MIRTTSIAILLAVVAACAIVSPVSADSHIPPVASASIVPDGINLVYDPSSGNLTTIAPQGKMLTAFEVLSASNSFTGNCSSELTDAFDVCTEQKVFKLATGGFSELNMGAVLPTGWTLTQLVNDLTLDGASAGGGFDVGSGAYAVVVPEPVSVVLLGIGGLLAVAGLRRR